MSDNDDLNSVHGSDEDENSVDEYDANCFENSDDVGNGDSDGDNSGD